MIRDPEQFTKWETEWLRDHPLDLDARFRLMEAMIEHARALGVFPPPDPLEGIDVDIRIARALNVRPSA